MPLVLITGRGAANVTLVEDMTENSFVNPTGNDCGYCFPSMMLMAFAWIGWSSFATGQPANHRTCACIKWQVERPLPSLRQRMLCDMTVRSGNDPKTSTGSWQ